MSDSNIDEMTAQLITTLRNYQKLQGVQNLADVIAAIGLTAGAVVEESGISKRQAKAISEQLQKLSFKVYESQRERRDAAMRPSTH